MTAQRRGRFITLEGIEGAGKSTCIRFVRERLQALGLPVAVTREPGGTRVGDDIRSILLAEGEVPPVPFAELLLLMAARVQNVKTRVEPLLEAGTWVLSDRFFDSTLAYQGAGRGIDMGRIRSLYELCLGDFTPDLTLLLDVGVQSGLARALQSGARDRFEAEDEAFFQRARQGFLAQAQLAPARYRVIDASRPLAEVEAELARHLDVFCHSPGRLDAAV